MRLNLIGFLEWKFPDLDRAWIVCLTLLTNAGEQDLARVMDHELTDVMLEFGELWRRMRHIVGWSWYELQGLTFSVDDLLVANS